MDKMQVVKELVTLQILYIRWMERNTEVRYETHGKVQEVLYRGCDFANASEAIKNLKRNIFERTHSAALKERVEKLEKNSHNDFKIGVDRKNSFSEEERELNYKMMQFYIELLNGMLTIKDASNILNIPESTIKQACQQERIMNTQKIGKTWVVNIEECKTYWGK